MKTINRDPVCGRKPKSAHGQMLLIEYKKKQYSFCSEACRDRFLKGVDLLRMKELAQTGALLSGGKTVWGVA